MIPQRIIIQQLTQQQEADFANEDLASSASNSATETPDALTSRRMMEGKQIKLLLPL